MFLSMEAPRLRVGLLTGLGIGLAIGMLFALVFAGYWPNVPMHAVATDRTEGFAVATGYCDESVEAVYFLDFATGDLERGGGFQADRPLQRLLHPQHSCRFENQSGTPSAVPLDDREC